MIVTGFKSKVANIILDDIKITFLFKGRTDVAFPSNVLKAHECEKQTGFLQKRSFF